MRGGVNVFNITEELNQLIFKYNIDKYYPQYRKKYKAEKILESILNKVVHNREKTILVSNDKVVLDIVKKVRVFSDEYIDVKHITGLIELEKIIWDNYTNIYILSLRETEKYGKWLRMHNKKYKWIYDVFEVEGLFFENEFYKILNDCQGEWFDVPYFGKEFLRDNWALEFYFQKMKYEYSTDEQIKIIALEKSFFLSIIMKNFVCAEKVLSSLGGNEIYVDFWKELQELLGKIKNALAKRKQKDIVWYWMDALSYEKSDGMPYLKEIMSRSTVFENAFTITPYTLPTLRNIFCKKRQVDDKAYKISSVNEDNSELLRFLSYKGYDFRCISGYMPCFEVSKVSNNHHSVFDSSSQIIWDVLENMIDNSNSMVILAHILSETHSPNLTIELNDRVIEDMKVRRELAKKELDVQLEYYDDFFNENTYRIYMSDHGDNQISTKFHIHWNVYNKNIVPRKVKGLISTLDLSKVLENIIEDKDIEDEIVYEDYIELQDLDRYGKHLIGDMIKKHEPPNILVFGYNGVVTQKYMYLKYRNGNEWLAERGNVKYEPSLMGFANEANIIIDESLLAELRNKAGIFFEDEEIREKCKYSAYLYKLYDNYLRRCKENMNIIYEVMKNYPKGTIALRMGGEHSAELYSRLEDEYKEKIGYIIDNNKECMCKKYGVPILTLEEAIHMNIKAIVLSSYMHIDMLRNEASAYPSDIAIIDIYNELEKRGICCKNNFYVDVQMTDEDYDVGFPFEDLN